MEHKEGTFAGHDGLELFYQCWLPEEEPRATVVIAHGLGEHGGRYPHLVSPLVPQGFAIYALDHRGHGRSAGPRGFIKSWADFREDLRLFVQLVQNEMEGRPLFLYGHSMGGGISAAYALQYPQGLDGVILSAPAVGKLDVPPLLALISRLLSGIAPGLSISTGLEAAAISRDPAVVDAYLHDPLVHDKGTPRLAVELSKSGLRSMEDAARFQPPLLLLHGDADRLVNVQASRDFYAAVPHDQKTLIIYEGGYHEPHNDIEHERVVQDIAAWLEKQLAS